MQQIYSQFDQHSNIVFKKFTNKEFLQNTENCLLIFDNSCVEIFKDKDFVKLATTGRHKSFNVNFVKLNLYQKVNGLEQWIWIQLISFCSNHHVTFSKSSFSVSNWILVIFWKIVMK